MLQGAEHSLAATDTAASAHSVCDTLETGWSGIFGAQSVLHESQITAGQLGEAVSLTDNPFYKILLVACFAFFCTLLYYYRSQLASLLNIFRGQSYVDKLLGEHNRLFDRFLTLSLTAGAVACGLLLAKFAEVWYGAESVAIVPAWAVGLVAPAFCVAVTVVALAQELILRLAGYLTYSRGFTAMISRMRKLIAAVAGIAVIPAALLFGLSTGEASEVLAHVVLAIAALAVIFLLMRTYLLFIFQKISILHWILYLCGVEIFPISLPVLLALKSI